ncbi:MULTISPECIES: DUF6880 family protein [unclassified Psychrobacter]|uniref:DUF6880 family protein n=2 Tax=Gammaproteobacteria TaxID=1236 RepID=UPI000405AAFF|nr:MULTISPECIES: DUF6880 family protein [unclassified Psychrobacter]
MLNAEQKKYLSQLSKTALIDFVSDVYGVDKMLDKKIERLLLQSDKPKLIKKLTTTLKGLRRRRKFVDYWESSEFATELQHLASDIMSLYPEQPQECLTLLELFIESTNASLGRADDSNGYIGDIYRSLTASWLTVASTCYEQEKRDILVDERDILSHAWVKKVKLLADDNDYGTKDSLLEDINELLSEPEIRGLIADYQQERENIQIKKANEDTLNERQNSPLSDDAFSINYEKMVIEIAIKNLSRALGDVGFFETIFFEMQETRPVHPRRLEELLTFLLNQRAFDKALHYLNEEWQSDGLLDKTRRLDWLSHIYHMQKNTNALMEVLGEVFELQPSPLRLKAIMAEASPAQQAQWRKRAYELAEQQENVFMATSLLLEIGEVELANQVAVARYCQFADVHYTALTGMLKELPAETDLLQVIIYRTLLNDILDSSRSKAYGHAARYFNRLTKLDTVISQSSKPYSELATHKEYVITLKDKHGRKRSFWEEVND